jgi:hypothetical protein
VNVPSLAFSRPVYGFLQLSADHSDLRAAIIHPKAVDSVLIGGYRMRHADPSSPSATAAKESDGLQPQAFMRPSLRQREWDMDARRPSIRTVGTRRE